MEDNNFEQEIRLECVVVGKYNNIKTHVSNLNVLTDLNVNINEFIKKLSPGRLSCFHTGNRRVVVQV